MLISTIISNNISPNSRIVSKILGGFASLIDTNKMKEPSFLMVIIGVGSYAYRRKDGVYVVPIGCLKN